MRRLARALFSFFVGGRDRAAPWRGAGIGLFDSDETRAAPISPGGAVGLPAVDSSWRIGRYEVIGEIGRGGMGVVVRARDPRLGRDVAIKMIIDPQSLPRRLARFEQEARAAARLRHPGIVTLHEVGESDGRPYLVMDFIAGESLDVVLDRGLAPRALADVLREVALALEHAHRAGIIHRDVKPENVLLDEAGRPHLTDFGVAREQGRTRLTRTGVFVGTPAYGSPEQIRGEAIGPATDVWALGAVLYRALVGEPPFEGESLVEIAHKVLTTDPVPPSQIDATVHRDLETIALRCLEKDPTRRYGSAGAVAADLGRFLDGVAIEARPLGPVERAVRWGRRRRAGILLAAVLVLAGVGITAGVGAGARRAREDLTADARAEARRARAAAATSNDPGDALADGRTGGAADALPRRLLLSLDALEAAARLHAMQPDDEAARDGAIASAVDLAEVALDAAQWELARSAVVRARRLGAPVELAEYLDERIADAEARAARERRERVEAVLARASAGELVLGQSDAYDDALFLLARSPDADTVALLCAKLDEVSGSLRAATRAALLEAADHVPGLEASVDRILALPPGEPAAAPDRERWDRALAVLEATARRRRASMAPGVSVDGSRLLAQAQARALGRTGPIVAKLICEALGRIGRSDAIDALGRYIHAEWDVYRALPAATALGRIGRPRGLVLALHARERLGRNGPLRSVIARFAGGLAGDRGDVVASSATSASDLIVLGELHALSGDPAAAIECYDRALAIDPAAVTALGGRALARRNLGRRTGRPELLDVAIADLDRAIEIAPCWSDAWLHRGLCRIDRGLVGAGLADLDEAIRLAPNDAIAVGIRGAIKHNRGDPRGAVPDLTRAVQLDPRRTAALCDRAKAFVKLGDLDRAIADYSFAVAIEPDDAKNWGERGRLLARVGRHEPAVRDLSRAIELDPSQGSWWYFRAGSRHRLGDPVGAKNDLDQCLEIDGDHPRALAMRGSVRLALGEPAAAIADLDRALRLEPRSAFARGERGRARIAAGDLAGAVEDLRVAIPLARDPARHLHDLGVALHGLGDPDGALAALDRAVQLTPGSPDVLTSRARVRVARGEIDAALEDLRGAIAADGEHAGAWAGLAVILRDAERLDQARQAADRAVSLAGSVASHAVMRADLLLLLGETEAALVDLDRAIELDPARAASWHHRGLARYEAGDRAGARSDFTRAIELAPDAPESWTQRGVLRGQDGDLSDAIEDLTRAIALAPERVEPWVARAAAFAAADRTMEAAADYARVLELAPEGPTAEAARAALRVLRP